MPNSVNTPRRTLLLTGASRGIGHATVIRFSSAGWRVITCSRHPFPEECPWGAGPEDHIQVDLADHTDTARAIQEIRDRLEGGELHALVNNAAISPKAEGGGPGLLTVNSQLGRSNRGPLDPDLDQLMSKHGLAFEKAWHEALDAGPDVPQVPQLPDVPAPSLASAFPDDEPPF